MFYFFFLFFFRPFFVGNPQINSGKCIPCMEFCNGNTGLCFPIDLFNSSLNLSSKSQRSGYDDSTQGNLLKGIGKKIVRTQVFRSLHTLFAYVLFSVNSLFITYSSNQITQKEPKFEAHVSKFDYHDLSPIFLATLLLHNPKVFQKPIIHHLLAIHGYNKLIKF